MKIKIFTGMFLVLLVSGALSYAQGDGMVTKIYSGRLHQDNSKDHSFLNSIFGGKSSKKDNNEEATATLEFKSPSSLAHQPMVEVPVALTYWVKFRRAQDPSSQRKDVLGKFVVKIYTNDGEDYLLDPNAEGQPAGPDGEFHTYDSYLIYLMLGQDINHFEIVSVSGDIKGKYVLDKLEIKADR